jgi:antitoxin (DNA-binding transcriptional repressor) of toxin-antitoxin stability system
MRTIGIRDLKAGLSRALRDVAAGEVFLVTDRGRVIAELRQPTTVGLDATPEQRALARLAARGLLRVAERPKPRHERASLRLPAGTAKKLLDADRDE